MTLCKITRQQIMIRTVKHSNVEQITRLKGRLADKLQVIANNVSGRSWFTVHGDLGLI